MENIEQNTNEHTWQDQIRRVGAYFVFSVLVFGPIYLGVYITFPWFGADEGFRDFILRNYAVFFILPYIGSLSFFLVVILESTRGPVEVEFASIKIKGAGGPLLFWVIVFVAVASMVKMFWSGWPS